MPARPRGSVRDPSRRIPTAIRKMEKQPKGNTTPSPPRISSRIRPNQPRRRTRSPRSTRKPILPRSPPKRRLSLSPKRSMARKGRDDIRIPPKRPRDSPKNRSKSPRQTPSPLPPRRQLSRERRPYSDREDSSRDKPKIRTLEKKYGEKPCEGPVKEFTYNQADLKKLTMRILQNTSGSTQINRTIVHSEDITIARRPGEGSTPIFDRQEIIEHRRKYDEDLGPSHSDRPHYEPSTSYNDNYRSRDYYPDKEKDRNINNSRRSPRDYDYKSRDDRPRDDLRYQSSSSAGRSRSYDRSRDYPTERKERYDDRDVHRGSRRSLDRDRGRSDDRPMRRHPSPADSRKHVDSYRDYEERRTRSLERRDVEQSHFRDHHDYSSGSRFSNADHSSKGREYYEADSRDNPSPSSRGRGSSFYSRGRGSSVPGRPFIRNTGFIVRQMPPVRAIRGAPIPRVAVPGRRLPFPSRFLPPVIQFFTPVRPRGIPLL